MGGDELTGWELTEEEIKKWKVPREKLKEKYYNPYTEQTLTYEENVRAADIDGEWDYNRHLSSPREAVDEYIKEGKLIPVK